MMHVALVTYTGLPQLAADDRLLQRALRERGHRADAVVWDDPTVEWGHYDLIVIRSCWDYHLRPDAFLTWISHLEGLGALLGNPPSLLRWNLDKRYLLDLIARGEEGRPGRTAGRAWLGRRGGEASDRRDRVSHLADKRSGSKRRAGAAGGLAR
jgi:hypothetical protein